MELSLSQGRQHGVNLLWKGATNMEFPSEGTKSFPLPHGLMAPPFWLRAFLCRLRTLLQNSRDVQSLEAGEAQPDQTPTLAVLRGALGASLHSVLASWKLPTQQGLSKPAGPETALLPGHCDIMSRTSTSYHHMSLHRSLSLVLPSYAHFPKRKVH